MIINLHKYRAMNVFMILGFENLSTINFNHMLFSDI